MLKTLNINEIYYFCPINFFWKLMKINSSPESFMIRDKDFSIVSCSPETLIDKKGNNTKISVKGRHDPCVGIRAVPIGEAMLSCVLLDHFMMNRAQCG